MIPAGTNSPPAQVSNPAIVIHAYIFNLVRTKLFENTFHQVPTVKRLESHSIYKSLEAGTPQDLTRIDKFD